MAGCRADALVITFSNNRPAVLPINPPARQSGGRSHERKVDMKKKLFIGLLAMAALVVFSLPAAAEKKGKGPPGFGSLYYDGDIVRTVVPPASMPFMGRDNLYAFPGGNHCSGTGRSGIPRGAMGPPSGDVEYKFLSFNLGSGSSGSGS